MPTLSDPGWGTARSFGPTTDLLFADAQRIAAMSSWFEVLAAQSA